MLIFDFLINQKFQDFRCGRRSKQSIPFSALGNVHCLPTLSRYIRAINSVRVKVDNEVATAHAKHILVV
jgi:hypothetical protein